MKRHTYHLTATAVLLLSTGILAGCSDDDDTLTQTQFTEQANAICSDSNAKIGQALGPIFSGEPTPDDLQAALDTIVTTSRDTRDQLANLAPPSAMSDQVDDMLAAFTAANDEAEAQGLGFFESDGDPWAPASVIAGSLGLDSCAGG